MTSSWESMSFETALTVLQRALPKEGLLCKKWDRPCHGHALFFWKQSGAIQCQTDKWNVCTAVHQLQARAERQRTRTESTRSKRGKCKGGRIHASSKGIDVYNGRFTLFSYQSTSCSLHSESWPQFSHDIHQLMHCVYRWQIYMLRLFRRSLTTGGWRMRNFSFSLICHPVYVFHL